MTRWEDIARATAGDDYAQVYAARFRDLAASGQDTHGEASFIAGVQAPPARVLDAGCGTGRIASRLDALGYDVVGVDIDERMLEVAREEAPDLDWRQADLATLELGEQFDLVLLAGNIIPLLEPGALHPAGARLAAHVAPGGLLLCGFGLDGDHLPPGCPVTPLAAYDEAMVAAGLALRERYAGWAREALTDDVGYAVSVHTSAGSA